MKTLKLLCITLLTVSLGRGVRLLTPASRELPTKFDAAQSAALFVGVRTFPNDRPIGEVKFAADDAVDLAWTFAIDSRVSLVAPERVVIALSGEPVKEASKARLGQLKQAGAVVRTTDDIVTLLKQQVSRVGTGGVFITSFATHGFSSEGEPYVLTASSVFERRETSLSAAKILEIAGKAPRSIVLLDACREPVGTRAPMLAPPVLKGLTESAGQVVLSISGDYAYDANGNGAFTASIISGLQCKAATDMRGVVTVETLWMYAEKHLLKWVRRNRDPNAVTATEVRMEGRTNTMPLAACSTPPPPLIARVDHDGETLIAISNEGTELWRRQVDGPITSARAADLDGDKFNEAIVAVGGKLIAFAPNREELWTRDTNAPLNYPFGTSMKVVKFITGDLYRKKRQQVVALSVDEGGAPASRLTIFDPDGSPRGAYFHPGRLLDVTVAAETARRAPKIIATGINDALYGTMNVQCHFGSLFMFDPKKVGGEAPPYRGHLKFGTQLWYGCLQADSEAELQIVDHNNDGQRDIALITANGGAYVDFGGKIIEVKNATFSLVK